MGSFVNRGAALALLAAAACGGGNGEGSAGAEGPRRDNWIADTQYMRDSLGNDLMVIIRRPAGAVVEVEPRAGSGDPDAPGAVEGIPPNEAGPLIANIRPAAYIIDVRDAELYVQQGKIRGAHLIPADVLEENISEIHVRTDQLVVVYADEDARAEAAARLLSSYGFPTVRWIEGGYLQWATLGLPTEQYR